jgi:uncharacterized protein (TIGR02284 family)
MLTDPKKVADQLNHLVQICLDGEEGFRQAAEAVEATELRTMFTEFSQQRAGLAADLQREVVRLGQEPAVDGTIMGAVHRGWLNLKSAVVTNDEKAIVNECERGEDVAVDAYEDALKSGLPNETELLVSRQFALVKAAHDRVRAAKNVFAQSAQE